MDDVVGPSRIDTAEIRRRRASTVQLVVVRLLPPARQAGKQAGRQDSCSGREVPQRGWYNE